MKQMWDKKEIEKIVDEHGGGTPANMVTTNTEQTINAVKTFNLGNEGGYVKLGTGNYTNPSVIIKQNDNTAQYGPDYIAYGEVDGDVDFYFMNDGENGIARMKDLPSTDDFATKAEVEEAQRAAEEAMTEAGSKTVVSGATSEGYWTTITIDGQEANIPQGGTGGSTVSGVKDSEGNWSSITIDGETGLIPNGGGEAPSNMVTTDTEQTITGTKKFANGGVTSFTPANGSTTGTHSTIGYDGFTTRSGSLFLKTEYNTTNYANKFGYKLNAGTGTKYISFPDKTGTLATLDDVQTPENMVTTDTEQTISGKKTFSTDAIFNTEFHVGDNENYGIVNGLGYKFHNSSGANITVQWNGVQFHDSDLPKYDQIFWPGMGDWGDHSQEIIVREELPNEETWTFTLADGTVVTKKVAVY